MSLSHATTTAGSHCRRPQFSGTCALASDYKVSGGTVRFHFDVPTPKVTVSRRNQDQDQETGQQPAEVDPKLQTSS